MPKSCWCGALFSAYINNLQFIKQMSLNIKNFCIDINLKSASAHKQSSGYSGVKAANGDPL